MSGAKRPRRVSEPAMPAGWLNGEIAVVGLARSGRAVASLLHMYGLIPKGNEPLVPYAIRMLTAINKLGEKSGKSKNDAVFDLAAEFKNTFSRRASRS